MIESPTPEVPEGTLPPQPLSPQATQRIRDRVRAEARRMRVSLAESAVHVGFAVGALAWAAAVVLG